MGEAREALSEVCLDERGLYPGVHVEFKLPAKLRSK